jgi:hypothetical protein
MMMSTVLVPRPALSGIIGGSGPVVEGVAGALPLSASTSLPLAAPLGATTTQITAALRDSASLRLVQLVEEAAPPAAAPVAHKRSRRNGTSPAGRPSRRSGGHG